MSFSIFMLIAIAAMLGFGAGYWSGDRAGFWRGRRSFLPSSYDYRPPTEEEFMEDFHEGDRVRRKE